MRRVLQAAAMLVSAVAASAEIAAVANQQELAAYLKAHWQSPEEYVVEKFKTHDIIFLGEYHRIRHDAELVQGLIPRLYKAGVYNLGFEFGNFDDQADLDRLLTAPAYDEAVARKMLFHAMPTWGYKEYLDIYHAAWQLNRSLPPDAPRFRVVNLNYRPNWSALQEKRTPETMKKVWYKGDGDVYMAQIVLDEFVAKNQKALIYCGIHHAFTRYHQPVYDFDKGRLMTLNDARMGNLVYKQIGSRAMTIFLHAPWDSSKGWDAPEVRPVNGVIDEVLSHFKDTRIGFDVVGTPFGTLPATDTYYALGYPNFKLADFTDGYIYQKPFRDYQGVTADPQFVTQDNLHEAIANLHTAEARKFLTSPKQFLKAMQEDADMQSRFKHLR
jgi:hypothetical protein